MSVISAISWSAHSLAALTYSQSSRCPISPLLYSSKNPRAAAILALRRRCTQSLWRMRPFPVVCPEYSSEQNGLSRNSANDTAMSARDLPLATRMYTQSFDTAMSACRRDGDADARASSREGRAGTPPPPCPRPRALPPPRDPFISDSSRRCQGAAAMRGGIAATAALHILVLAKRALRTVVLHTLMPSWAARARAMSLSGMRRR